MSEDGERYEGETLMVQIVIDPLHQAFDEMRNALRSVLRNHTYKVEGHDNCRFCDNDMDHEGTFEDMHDEDCVIHAVRKALKAAKAAT